MAFYCFSQNNSGGVFDFDRSQGITHYVIIEADTADEANDIAEDIGIYFDGAGDCPCCGNRWRTAEKYDKKDAPLVCGKPFNEKKDEYNFMNGKPVSVVHYKDGRVVWSGE